MVIVALADGFETMEALVPVDVLRRAGVEVSLAGCESLSVRSAQGVEVKADGLIGALSPGEVEMLVLPGGPGVEALSGCDALQALIRACAEQGKLIGAICAAPALLARLGLLSGRRAVCHPSVQDELLRHGARLQTDERVTHDRNLVTAHAAGSSIEFGLKLLAMLRGWDASESVRRAIYFDESTRVLT